MTPHPPPSRPGFRWEWRQSCCCKPETCYWYPNCISKDWPHWVEVEDVDEVNR